MFKSITYLKYNRYTNCYVYKLIDTDFDCNVFLSVGAVPIGSGRAESPAAPIAAAAIEYQKRNLPVLPNLFKCNLYLCNTYKFSFEEILEWQVAYTDKYFKGIFFNEKYYKKLKRMWNKHKLFI